MINSLIAAFAMYSRIPMPHIEWNDKTTTYCICCFPAVGGVIGACSMGCFYLFQALKIGNVLSAAVLSVLPILITGGIHMDGFLDTMDAKNSYRSAEEKLKIMKDPHLGAFAVIYGLTYMLLTLGLFSEITAQGIGCMAVGYGFSRILSGLSVVTLQKAKREGMVSAVAEVSDRHNKWILLTELMICVVLLLIQWRWMGLAVAAAGGLSFLYYRHMAYRDFGGITGDLAGYFLQICELLILMVVVVLQRFVA